MLQPDRCDPTVCPYCGVGCNLELHVKDEYIYRVTSPFDSVVNQGNLCVKGRFGYDLHLPPEPRDHAPDPQDAPEAGRAHPGLRPDPSGAR